MELFLVYAGFTQFMEFQKLSHQNQLQVSEKKKIIYIVILKGQIMQEQLCRFWVFLFSV